VVEIMWRDTGRMRMSDHFSEASLVLPQETLSRSRIDSSPRRIAGLNKEETG